MIGQFSGPYSPVAKLFSDLSQIVLNFIASKNLKLYFTLNYVLKRIDRFFPFEEKTRSVTYGTALELDK